LDPPLAADDDDNDDDANRADVKCHQSVSSDYHTNSALFGWSHSSVSSVSLSLSVSPCLCLSVCVCVCVSLPCLFVHVCIGDCRQLHQCRQQQRQQHRQTDRQTDGSRDADIHTAATKRPPTIEFAFAIKNITERRR